MKKQIHYVPDSPNSLFFKFMPIATLNIDDKQNFEVIKKIINPVWAYSISRLLLVEA